MVKIHCSNYRKECHVNFACDPLHSYFDECQKNEIHLLYLHYFRNNFHHLKSVLTETIQNNNLFRSITGHILQLRENGHCVFIS